MARRAAGKAGRGRGRSRQAGRPRLGWALVSTGVFVVLGFGVGLLVGALWETPERVLPLLSGAGERVPLAVLERPGGDTAPPEGEMETTELARAMKPPPAAAPPPVAAPPPAEPESGPFAIQVGSFTEPVPAWKLAEQLGEKHYEVYVDEGDAAGRPRWRVRVGPVTDREQARRLADRLKSREGLPTWILAEEGSG